SGGGGACSFLGVSRTTLKTQAKIRPARIARVMPNTVLAVIAALRSGGVPVLRIKVCLPCAMRLFPGGLAHASSQDRLFYFLVVYSFNITVQATSSSPWKLIPTSCSRSGDAARAETRTQT